MTIKKRVQRSLKVLQHSTTKMATRIQHKRSSILGRRPSKEYLEPGELALNTNQKDPGLFFETNTGEIAKAGPAHIGFEPPQSDVGYGPGEAWLNSGNGTFNLWAPALNRWIPIQSPFFGGAQTAIFVGSEFPEASDSLTNDGSAIPFASLNRAMLEVARRSILAGRSDDVFNGRFTIVLLPGRNVVYNEPGVTLGDFEQFITGFSETDKITQGILRLFNGVSGGLLVPRGTSIIAFDLRKTEIVPTYYPFWSRTLFELDSSFVESRSSILKWTGNCYFTSFTFRDKVGDVSVTSIRSETETPGGVAILQSIRPHGFRSLVTSDGSTQEIIAADRINFSYPRGVSQFFDNEPVLAAGEFYADPINSYEFRLRKITDGSFVVRKELPETGTPGANPPEIAIIHFPLTTHHRLSAIEYATQRELNVYYSKVQRAFSLLTFAGTVNNADVVESETTIVSNTPQIPDFAVNTVDNASPYIFNVTVRSEWGMNGADVNGAQVNGFKSALFCNFTSVSLQNDAETYEVYDALSQKWIGLKQRYANATGKQLVDVTNDDAISYLISPAIRVEDIRFYHRPSKDIEGADSKSSGLIDDMSDTRNYAVLCRNSAFSQIHNSFAIGVAVNYWAKSGGRISIVGANSNFGGIALRAEGFKGIGTAGGADPADTGFVIRGIRRPAAITRRMITDPPTFRRIFLNARIVSSTATSLTFDTQIDESVLLPFTLRPQTYIWVENYATGLIFRAQLSDNPVLTSGTDPCGGSTINIVNGTNDIHTAILDGTDPELLSLPYIRRFSDPRPPIDRVYSLWVSNTNASHRPPELGTILRFAEKPPAGSANLLKIGAQLDPGFNGGWGHIFQVSDSRTKSEGDNPNGSEPLIVPALSASNYYISILGVDQFRPWIIQGENGFEQGPVQTDYPSGFYSTFDERIFYANQNDLADTFSKPLPIDGDSVWARAKNFEYCQPVQDAWQATSTVNVEDPFISSYPANACYPRGVQYDRTVSAFDLVIDFDDGTDTLGVLNTIGNTDLADPDLYDPWWHPTKAAMTRFLVLLGFSYDAIKQIIQPQLWTSRNITVDSLPQVTTGGYALQTGEWPVEFNRPSTIGCGSHTWEWSGYINYSKGLQQYQNSQLSLRERFDAMLSETWGGVVVANGTDERGEFSITGKTVAGGTGVTLLRTDTPSTTFFSQSTVKS